MASQIRRKTKNRTDWVEFQGLGGTEKIVVQRLVVFAMATDQDDDGKVFLKLYFSSRYLKKLRTKLGGPKPGHQSMAYWERGRLNTTSIIISAQQASSRFCGLKS